MNNLQDALTQVENDYQAVCGRRAEARAELNNLREEVERMRHDSSTKPATLSKIIADLTAREMLFPAIEADVTSLHQRMMNCRQAIADYANLQQAKGIRLTVMQDELKQMKREYADKQHQLEHFEEVIRRHEDALNALKSELAES